MNNRIPVVVLLALASLAACKKAPVAIEDIRPVRTLTVGATPTQATNTYAGEVRARYESALGFRVPGKLISRRADVGVEVKAGQLLAQLDPSDLQLGEASAKAQVLAAQAQYNVAKLDLERVRGLRDKGFASAGEFDRYETQFKAARAQLEAVTAQSEQIENQTRYGSLSADADGVVTAVLAEAGQVVAAGQPVFQIARKGEIEIAAAIPEDQINFIRVGMPVTVSLWSETGKTYAGSVRELSSAADPRTRTYSVRVAVSQPPKEMRLRMTATIAIPLQGLPDLIHLPPSAAVAQDGKAGVWVVDAKTSTVQFRPTEFAGVDGNAMLISGGLAPGDVVVTAGAAYLHAGQKVRLLGAPPAGPAAAVAPAAG